MSFLAKQNKTPWAASCCITRALFVLIRPSFNLLSQTLKLLLTKHWSRHSTGKKVGAFKVLFIILLSNKKVRKLKDVTIQLIENNCKTFNKKIGYFWFKIWIFDMKNHQKHFLGWLTFYRLGLNCNRMCIFGPCRI